MALETRTPLLCEYSFSPVPSRFDFHLHNQYEIYMLEAGAVHYFVEQHKYKLEPWDILIFNSREVHRPTFVKNDVYKRYVIHFDPGMVHRYTPPSPSLLACFENRVRGQGNLIRLPIKQREQVVDLLHQMCHAPVQPFSETQKLVWLLQVLLIISQWHLGGVELQAALKPPIAEILRYINENLQQPLSLEGLSEQFYIQKNYMCRLFRQQTGNTIHSYIRLKRVALAKQLLEEGISVMEVCSLCGFGDYSHFIRSFRQLTGVTPARYGKING